jgi:mono/diheme cytochrome c family protein
MISRLFLSIALVTPLLAEDGPQLYTQYCSACHALDGKGATGGTFPPLAGSPYIAGDPARAVKIALKGLTGPVDVLDKTYNLEMPPQGAVLSDEQLASILTYVRKSWGNQAGPVTPEQVKTIRASVADRAMPWTAPEILKLHPLPLEKTVLANLLSQTYPGKWSAMPDFSKEKATNVEEEHNGILTLKNAPAAENFAMVWTGDFVAPTNGQFTFLLDADDAAILYIDNSKVTEIKGSGPMNGTRAKQGMLTLIEGRHPFRVEYLQTASNKGLALAWSSSRAKNQHWLSEDTIKTKAKKTRVPIPIGPTADRPVIYRNFIAGTSTRSIGVGFPGGVNLAYSADNLAPELLWTGSFIDGSNKWAERGTADNPPAGDQIVNPSKSRALPEDARFTGYELDPSGNPSFEISIGSATLVDSYQAQTKAIVRKLTLSGSGPAIDITIAEKSVAAQLSITAEGGTLETNNNKTTLKLTPAKAVTLTYQWKP